MTKVYFADHSQICWFAS